MECHYHPGVPGVASCAVCHVFICQRCMRLNERPGEARCSDCLLRIVQDDIGNLTGRLTAAIVVATIVLVVSEVLLGVLVSTLATDIVGVLLAYLAGALVLSFPLGPLFAPWLVVDKLSKLEKRREEEANILAIRDGRPLPRGDNPPQSPPPGEPVPAAFPAGPTPSGQPRPTPRLGPRRRFGQRRHGRS